MNIPQYARIIERTKEVGLQCIDENAHPRETMNSWRSYVSAKFAGISEVIISDPDISLADYDELSGLIKKAEIEIWDYKM